MILKRLKSLLLKGELTILDPPPFEFFSFVLKRSMKNFIRRLALKINTKAQLLKLKNVLKVLQADNHFTVSAIDKIIAEVESRLEMLSFQVFYVEPWLDNNAVNDV